MLLIARRKSESVIINGTIEVKIIEIKGNRVKLGFEYPEGNTVYREEIFQKIQQENRSALQKVDKNKLESVLKKFSIPQKESGSESDQTGKETTTLSAKPISKTKQTSTDDKDN